MVLRVHAAVLDMRWLSPLDEEALASALPAAGGKVLIVHDVNMTGGFVPRSQLGLRIDTFT